MYIIGDIENAQACVKRRKALRSPSDGRHETVGVGYGSNLMLYQIILRGISDI